MHTITYNNVEYKSLSALARAYKLTPDVLRSRLKRMDMDQALSQPMHNPHKSPTPVTNPIIDIIKAILKEEGEWMNIYAILNHPTLPHLSNQSLSGRLFHMAARGHIESKGKGIGKMYRACLTEPQWAGDESHRIDEQTHRLVISGNN
jgi:hypothetical protein